MKTYLGVDWGTHSSKWVARQSAGGPPIVGKIWDSGVSNINNHLAMFPLETRAEHAARETGLKRKLIQDPDQSFWEGIRPKLKVTLGEAVVFSLLALLLDAKRTLVARRNPLRELEVRFSHPNWIDETNINALACFRDAAVIALKIFLDGSFVANGEDSVKVSIDALRQAITRVRASSDLPRFPELYEHDEFGKCVQGIANGHRWLLTFESCAAGFPYLIQADLDIFEDEITKLPATKRVRKILVVDVGAGSTDAGYLVRTVRPRDANKIMKPLLIWLPAANALEIAGRWLTDKILADMKQQGRRMTYGEAEDLKVSRPTAWNGKPYVQEWSAKIADHVGDYVETIRDEVCLNADPPLEVVVTGGSSAVETMKNRVLETTRSALQKRKLSESFANATKLLSSSAISGTLTGYRDVEVAQLAVALGASDPYLSELKAYPDGLRAIASMGVAL